MGNTGRAEGRDGGSLIDGNEGGRPSLLFSMVGFGRGGALGLFSSSLLGGRTGNSASSYRGARTV